MHGLKPVGTYEEVFNGLARRTRSGLRREDLTTGAKGGVVSLARQKQALRRGFGVAGGLPRGAAKMHGKRRVGYWNSAVLFPYSFF